MVYVYRYGVYTLIRATVVHVGTWTPFRARLYIIGAASIFVYLEQASITEGPFMDPAF